MLVPFLQVWAAGRTSGVPLWTREREDLIDISMQRCWVLLDWSVCVSGESSLTEMDISITRLGVRWYKCLSSLKPEDWMRSSRRVIINRENKLPEEWAPNTVASKRLERRESFGKHDWKVIAYQVGVKARECTIAESKEEGVLKEEEMNHWVKFCWDVAYEDWKSPMESGNVKVIDSLKRLAWE